MKQVFVTKGKISVKNVSIPPLSDGMVLVRVHYSFISSGTEAATVRSSSRSIFSKVFGSFKTSATKVFGALRDNGIFYAASMIKGALKKSFCVGYSCSGQVVKASFNSSFSAGDWVTCAGSGFAVHGEFVVVPKNLVVRLNSTKNLRETSVVAMAAVAMQGVRRAGVSLGDNVCVIGLGLVGLLTVQMLKIAGCRVFGIDLEKERLDIGKKLGCTKCFKAVDKKNKENLERETEGKGVDVTIITASSQSGKVVDKAIEFTRRRGKVVVIGDVKLDFSRDLFYQKELDLLISCSYGPGRYDWKYEDAGLDYPYEFVRWTENRNMKFALDLIENGKLDVLPLISKEFSLEKASNAYDYLKKEKPIGIVFSYMDKAFVPKSMKLGKKTNFTHKKDTFNVAIVGAGGFAKTKLLPILNSISDVNVSCVVGRSADGALNFSRQFNIPNFTTNYDDVLLDNSIDTVIVATPHRFHTNQALSAMKAGKTVFCEKPAAVTFDELRELRAFFDENNDFRYCVDFNRSHSPFISKTLDCLEERSGPIVIDYRMNVGQIPKNHWLEDPRNGGRIIGEACHIFELFLVLTKSMPTSVSVAVANKAFPNSTFSENFCANFSFQDGSVANLTYTSVGSLKTPKERMEIFFDGKSIAMNDFLSLRSYGFENDCDEKTSFQDKGHTEVLKAFFSRKFDEENKKNIFRIICATEMSLQVNRLARLGGGFHIFDRKDLRKFDLCVG
ncbi:bi-domain-containing oxidoreductase [Candidatus Dependentiae bacterium]